MHGMIHTELRKFVVENYNEETWEIILTKAGLSGKKYLTMQNYSDKETLAIVGAAVEVSGIPLEDLLETFGKFIAPDLIRMYRALVNPSWKTKEFLLNIEGTMHKAVRDRNVGAKPPVLYFRDIGDNKLHFIYNSSRKLTPVAIGIMKGVAEQYDETITVSPTGNNDADSTEFIIEIEASA